MLWVRISLIKDKFRLFSILDIKIIWNMCIYIFVSECLKNIKLEL